MKCVRCGNSLIPKGWETISQNSDHRFRTLADRPMWGCNSCGYQHVSTQNSIPLHIMSMILTHRPNATWDELHNLWNSEYLCGDTKRW